MSPPLNNNVAARSRDWLVRSWFWCAARRSSSASQRETNAMLTGISMANTMMSHRRRVRPLRSTELYGLPLIELPRARCIPATKMSTPLRSGLYGIRAPANACRVTNATAPFSGGGFPGGIGAAGLRRLGLGELADGRVAVAINATRTAACGAEHGAGHGFGRDCAVSLASPGEKRIGERCYQRAQELERPNVLARTQQQAGLHDLERRESDRGYRVFHLGLGALVELAGTDVGADRGHH